jgi:hypothetical protein
MTWSNSEMHVGALSAKWPTGESGDLSYWKSLRESVEAVRGLMELLNGRFIDVDKDPNLSPVGRANQRTKMAREALEELKAFEPLTRASNTVARRIANLKEKLTALPGPSSVADIHLAAEIRAAIKQHKTPEAFAFELRSDPKAMAAVLAAPAFLSGLKDEAVGRLREAALQALHPQEVQEIADLEQAQKVAADAVRVASERIAQRAGLQKNMNGEYTAAPTAAK